jgi:hypothetical protein
LNGKDTSNFGASHSLLGKRKQAEACNNNLDPDSISDELQAGLVIADQEEEKVPVCPPQPKRQALMKDFVDKIPWQSNKMDLFQNSVVIQTQG